MQIIIDELRVVINKYNEKMSFLRNDQFYAKPIPSKWSRIEILGHLIDSAQNNLRRFICGQYESSPALITYNQDFWVAANQYTSADKEEMVQLWTLLNKRIISVLEAMPASGYEKYCPIVTGGQQTLEWLATDYVKHLKHHLNQILPGSFNISYP